jgi:dienelactone hydrolase
VVKKNHGDSFADQQSHHNEGMMTVETQQVAYRDGDARLNGFLAVDAARRDKRPGILVVHGGSGLDDHARGRARRFAEAGFVVFACDMYGEGINSRDAIGAFFVEIFE